MSAIAEIEAEAHTRLFGKIRYFVRTEDGKLIVDDDGCDMPVATIDLAGLSPAEIAAQVIDQVGKIIRDNAQDEALEAAIKAINELK